MLVTFRTTTSVFIGAAITTAFVLLLMMLHVHINYDPVMAEIVRPRAAISVTVVAFPLCIFFFRQMHKNYLLSEELQRLVSRDRLTDVATRDHFFGLMDAQPDAIGVSLMVDIDHFKKINDVHGHLFGDEVIRAVATILRKNSLPEDIICRFGGEEFLIFLAGKSKKEAFVIAERMRNSVTDGVIKMLGQAIDVTISIGGSPKAQLDKLEETIKLADDALYRAKYAGRNRTIFS